MDIGKVTLICVGIYAIVMGIRAAIRKQTLVAKYGHEDPRAQYDDSNVEVSGFAAVKTGVTWIAVGLAMLVGAFKFF